MQRTPALLRLVSCARPFAAAVQEDGASFTGILECCPVRQKNTIVFPPSPPFAEIWDFLVNWGCLIQVKTGLKQCSLYMFKENCLWRWDVLQSLFTACKKTMPGFIYLSQTTSFTIHYNDKSFQFLHVERPKAEAWRCIGQTRNRCGSNSPELTIAVQVLVYTIMELELLMCRFIRSLREGDFPLYVHVHVCDELCAWFHAMDQTHYARWVPVRVRDMVQLSETHPDKHAEFLKGNFVVQKSTHKFSLIGKDQSHEQSNKSLQSHGGAVGLYENPEALTLFMLAGPDCSRCVEEFEVVLDTPRSSTAHHEEAHSLQVKYRKDVLSVVETVE